MLKTDSEFKKQFLNHADSEFKKIIFAKRINVLRFIFWMWK